MSEEIKALDFFKPEDFENDGGFESFADREIAADFANEKLNQLVESWPVVYAENVHLPWHNVSFQGATRQARLAFIAEIKKEPCKHEPILTRNADGYAERYICKHCGVPLKAKWEAANE